MRALAFRIGDIPVKVDPTFWIIMGLFGFSRASTQGGFDIVLVIEWVAMVFVGILVHELGHAVAFRAYGRPPSVVLYAMGGLTSARGGLTPGRRLVTTLAGPGVGFAVGGLALAARATGVWDLPRLEGFSVGQLLGESAFAAFGDYRLSELIFLDLLFINIGWGVLNLIPLHPLDGGQSVEALLGLMRVKRAELITSVLGVVVAAAGAWFAVQISQVFLVLIMLFLGLMNLRRVGALLRPQAPQTPVGSAQAFSPELQRTLELAEQALRQDRPGEAVELLRQEHAYRPSTESTRVYLAVLARTRRYDDIEEVLAGGTGHIDHATLTAVAGSLVSGGRYEAGLRAAEAAWNADASGDWTHAVTAAAARAGLRDVDGAVRWLLTAADHGWTDRRRLESDPIFAEVRTDPRMADILARMGV
ncbi:hypothetical protein BH23ACT9_BH23ACT9_07650 [soil metagenome]